MKDQRKTKAQLIKELEEMRVRVSEVEASEAGYKRAEEKIRHLNAVLRAIRNVNQLITKEKDLGRLLQGICDNLVRNRGYHNVWIALLDEFKGLVATAEAGLGEAFQPIAQRLRRGMFMGCGQKALARPGVVVTEDPFSECVDCPLAAGYGGRGAMTVRLEFEGSVYGLLAVSVPRHLAMDEEEWALFKEVSEDIAFALRKIELEEGRKLAGEALRLAAAYASNLIETSLDPFVTIDEEGKITDVNASTEEVTGCLRKELIGTEFSAYFTDPEKVEAGHQEAFSKGSVRDYDLEIRRRDGHVTPVLYNASVYRDETGRIAGVVAAARDVTEWKKAEKALKEGEELFRTLFETAPIGLVLTNPSNGFVLSYNQKGVELFGGSSPQEFIGRAAIDFYRNPEDRSRVVAAMKEHGAVKDMEIAFKTPDNRSFLGLFSGAMIKYGGEPTILSVVVDITERKKAEEALKEGEELFRTLFETAPIGLVLTSPSDGAIVDCNQKITELFNIHQDEFIGKQAVDFYVNSVERSRIVATIKKYGFIKDVEVAFKTLDGGQFLGLLSSTVTKYGGEPTILSVIVDITERKQAEEALKESEELFRTLFEIAPIGLVLTSPSDGAIVDCNQKITELFNIHQDEFIGKQAVDFYVNSVERSRIVAIIKKYGFIKDVEVVFKTLDGGQFWGLLSSTVTKYGGEPTILSVIVDITERKQAEEALQNARNELESRVEERTSDLVEVNRQLMREIKERIRAEGALKSSIAEKEILIREIHHRVKNNLQVISSLLDMGNMRIRDASQAHEMFKEAGSIIQAMALIHSMLYGAREFESVNIAEFVRKLYAQLAQMYVGQSKKITPEFHLEDVHLSIDKAVPLGLVLNEILANVFKHAFPGDDSGKVEIHLRKDYTDKVFLRISDNGTGIPEEIDVEAANSMGLKLIRIIVREQLRGALSVERERGTTTSMEFIALRTGDSNDRANV